MRTDRFALALALACLLAGCAVAPAYVPPDMPTAAAYEGSARLAARAGDAPAPALEDWWRGFDDPGLTRVVTQALAQNLDLAASAERVAQARAVARRASSERLPAGSLDASAARERQSLRSPLGEIASSFPGYERDRTLESAAVGASWETDLAGGLRHASEAANAEFEAAEAAHAGVRVTLVAEAADAYLRVRGAQARIAITQDQIRNETALVDLVRLRQSRGVGTLREVAQSEAVLLEAQAAVPPLRRELAAQGFRLDVLMGMTPGASADELAADHGEAAIPRIDTVGGPSELLRRRPDVIAAERRLAASNARIGVAIAQYYPSLSLSGLLGFESLATRKLFTPSAFQPAALAGLHWRLFDFGRIDAEVAQARGANREALLDYRSAMLQATRDVEDAIVSLTELERQHTLLNAEVRAHARARDAAQDAFRGGAVSLVEVLDEDRALLASRDLLASVHADTARSAVATFRALGGGWSAAATR